MRHAFRAAVAFFVGHAAALASAALAAPLTIADIAPPDSAMVVGCDDWTRAQEAFGRTSLAAALADEPMKQFLIRYFAPGFAAPAEPDKAPEPGAVEAWLKQLHKDSGLDLATLPRPRAAIGFAMAVEPRKEGEATGANSVVAMADFGPDAAKFESDLLDAARELEKRGHVVLTERAHAGATIHTIAAADVNAWYQRTMRPEFDPDMGAFEDGMEGEDEDRAKRFAERMKVFQAERDEQTLKMLRQVEKTHFVRVNDVVLLSNSADRLDRALDIVQAPAAQPGNSAVVASSADYRAGRQAVDGAHAYIVYPLAANARGFRDNMAGNIGNFPVEATAMIDWITDEKNLAVLGLAGTQALSMGLWFDTDRSSAELSFHMVQPRLGGIFSLFAAAPGGFVPPAASSAESAGIVTTHFNFAGVIPFVRQIIAALPEESRGQPEAGLAQAEPILGPLLDAIGPEISIVESLERPLAPASGVTVVSIALKDRIPVLNVLTGFGPMAGLAPVDFEGRQIFESEESGIAVGIGDAHLLLGAPKHVRDAMRLAGAKGEGLSAAPGFRKAAAAAAPGAALYAFRDVRQFFEWEAWRSKNAEAIFRAEMQEYGIDPDADGFEPDEPEPWAKDMPAADQFARYFGDLFTEMHARPQGIEARVRLLKP